MPAATFLALLLFLGNAAPAHAQGCSACRDATAGSPPKAREGLRKAILVLGIPAGSLFVAVLLVARRIEQNRNA